jgi:hypothetical protein
MAMLTIIQYLTLPVGRLDYMALRFVDTQLYVACVFAMCVKPPYSESYTLCLANNDRLPLTQAQFEDVLPNIHNPIRTRT